MNYYIKYGHKYWLENGYLVRIDYSNGNYVERKYKSIALIDSRDKWYRQDGTQVIININDIQIYDANGRHQETHYVGGYKEKYIDK